MPQTAQTPRQRLEAADVAFKESVRVLPAGISGVAVPPWTELMASHEGLVALLAEKGVITAEEHEDAKHTRWAEMLEELTAQVGELKRQHTGLILAGPGQPV